MKTKMHFPIPTTFKVLDAFLGSVNTTGMPNRLRAARVATMGNGTLIRAKRHHWFFLSGTFGDFVGYGAGDFNSQIRRLIDLYVIMYPQRRGNANAFIRWWEQEGKRLEREVAVNALHYKARELGYTLTKP